ncbi:hypothetical protein ANN_13744 [Periplaneta americana]|uniref:PiggyBac transposable element-derived protein domain-containing protein n=1 Tax=Periplaneta americana TaxID=6978 RepID=A0ABQ8SVQ1_PERAM|nr:hypothetical protein ANN_13744 [Periplaneta americana]
MNTKLQILLRNPGNWMKYEKVAFHDPPDNIDRVGENHLGKSEFEIFCLFMMPGMIEEIVQQALVYARRDKNGHSFDVSTEEMCQFLGLLLVSGYHTLPGENDYWSTCEDLSVPIFGKVMSRDRFHQIKRYLHIADNNNLVKSKVIWMLCATDGYPCNMEIYCGKSESDGSLLGSRVVMNMLSIVPNSNNHIVFFDNFFTRHSLLEDLTKKNFRACGTVRENRTNKCPLVPTNELKKERGTFDYKSDGKIICVKWNDNAVVTVASNHFTATPIQKTHRRVKSENKEEVQQPNLIHKYNLGMGGVDQLDRLASSYRRRLRSKKWWWGLFSNGLNMSVIAAFRFFQYLHPEQK